MHAEEKNKGLGDKKKKVICPRSRVTNLNAQETDHHTSRVLKLEAHTLPAVLAEGLHTAQIRTALFRSDTSL